MLLSSRPSIPLRFPHILFFHFCEVCRFSERILPRSVRVLLKEWIFEINTIDFIYSLRRFAQENVCSSKVHNRWKFLKIYLFLLFSRKTTFKLNFPMYQMWRNFDAVRILSCNYLSDIRAHLRTKYFDTIWLNSSLHRATLLWIYLLKLCLQTVFLRCKIS